tara:strand:- start:7845 stop:8831 length:987 start_codon:yes stop_codon:yes gene_type:complete
MDVLSVDDVRALEQICPGGLTQNENLALLSQWKVGGFADLVISPSKTAELAALRKFFKVRSIPHIVIGKTSNLLFADDGLRVPCIRIGNRMAGIQITDTNMQAQAGCWVPSIARRAMQAGLTGIEHICGIPGTLGGLICMNGGSQRKGIGSHILTVESVNDAGYVVNRSVEECGFSYRHSIFHDNNEIISAATLRLAPGDRDKIRSELREILGSRRRKFPRKQPNCGSTFISDPALYAEYGSPGSIIENLGFKGMKIGGAKVSELHANFLVNVGGAKAQDILALIWTINIAVKENTGRALLAEVRYVSPQGQTWAASEVNPIMRDTSK